MGFLTTILMRWTFCCPLQSPLEAPFVSSTPPSYPLLLLLLYQWVGVMSVAQSLKTPSVTVASMASIALSAWTGSAAGSLSHPTPTTSLVRRLLFFLAPFRYCPFHSLLLYPLNPPFPTIPLKTDCYYPQTPPPPPPHPGNLTVTIDLLDFWLIPGPLPQPPNSISILDHGADPTGVRDSTSSIIAALAAAAAAQAPLWVPSGTFTVTQPLQLTSNLTVIGAGPWHALFKGNGVGLVGGKDGKAVFGVRVSGLGVMGDTRIRDDSAQDAGVFGALSDSVLTDLSISHTKCGMWLSGPFDSLLISGVRIHDTTADGINFCSGVTHSRVEHCIVRNTGDDGLAMWSANGRADTNNTFEANTVQVPVLANAIAIYGGSDNSAIGNAVADVLTQGGGLHVGNRFSAVPLGGKTLLQGNSLLRCGCLDQNWQFGVGAVWFYALDEALTGEVTCTGNTLVDSPYEAYHFIGKGGVSGVSLVNESVVNVGTFVLQLQAPGGAFVQGLVATGTQKAGVYNCSSGFALVDGGGNAGFASQVCGFSKLAVT